MISYERTHRRKIHRKGLSAGLDLHRPPALGRLHGARAERAGENYYKGIRETPYAPFVKLCDRLANITYSCAGDDPNNVRMREVYKQEVPHFLASINPHSDDSRFKVPQPVVIKLAECLIDDLEREEQNGKVWWHEY